MENKLDSSETFQANSSFKYDTKLNESFTGIKDFNNIETADHKLVVNDRLSYWVHEEILSGVSDYFYDIFTNETINSQTNKSSNNNNNEKLINKQISLTKLSVPIIDNNSYTDTLFFDVLLWIYTKDFKKIKKYTQHFKHFTRIIVLASYLKLRGKFIEGLLSKVEFKWEDLDNYNDVYWSREHFNFEILEKISSNINCKNCTKIVFMLSWIQNFNNKANNENINNNLNSLDIKDNNNLSKINNVNTSSNLKLNKQTNKSISDSVNKSSSINPKLSSVKSKLNINESLNSSVISMKESIIKKLSNYNLVEYTNNPDKSYATDCYLVRNFMIAYDLTEKLSFENLNYVFKNFKSNLLALDTKPIINDFLFNSNKILICICCEKEFISPIQVINSSECKGKNYHPRVSVKQYIDKGFYECYHEGCTQKINKSEYPCCHKIINQENSKKGCIQGDGKHVIVIKEVY